MATHLSAVADWIEVVKVALHQNGMRPGGPPRAKNKTRHTLVVYPKAADLPLNETKCSTTLMISFRQSIPMKYFVYVIQSVEGYHYTGMTEDLELRLEQHNNHALSLWTRRGTRWKVVYFEELDSKDAALKREKWLKTGVGRDFLRRVIRSRTEL